MDFDYNGDGHDQMIIDDDDYDYYDCIHKHWTGHLKNISCQYRIHLTGDDPENVELVSSFFQKTTSKYQLMVRNKN